MKKKSNVTPRKIALSDVCAIIKDTALASAPKLQEIGDALEHVGERADLPAVQVVGGSIERIARMTIQVLQLLGEDPSITIVDQNGSRGITDQVVAMKAFKRIQKEAT